jgi:membrane protein insertase Oxa1/YidC/SpoIIIJ
VQFAQLSFSLPPQTPRDPNKAPSFAEEFQRTFQWQARFLFPLLIGFVAWTLPSAVALYFITSSLFQMAQDWVIRRKVSQERQVAAGGGAKSAPGAQSVS